MRLGRRSAPRALLLGIVTALLLGCTGDDDGGAAAGTPDLHVSAAQASAPVAGASQLVLSIENRGDGDDLLIGADTDAAIAVEVHRTVVEDDGRAVMRLLDDVALPAGTTVRFRPGELHLMVVVPDERVVVGGTFDVTLRFARSAPVTVTADVVGLLDLVEDDGPAGELMHPVTEGDGWDAGRGDATSSRSSRRPSSSARAARPPRARPR